MTQQTESRLWLCTFAIVAAVTLYTCWHISERQTKQMMGEDFNIIVTGARKQ